MIKRPHGLRSIDKSMYLAMSLDPGVKGTGVALWNMETWGQEGSMPVDVFNIVPGPGSSWLGVAHGMAEDYRKVFQNFNIARVDSEFPQFFDSAGGHSTAARGDLQKLTFIVGVYAGITWDFKAIWYPWLVNEWKGQLSKEIVERKILRRIPEVTKLGVESHMWDAIGIGLHAQGRFVLKTNNNTNAY